MQKWDYCMVGPIRSAENRIDGQYPHLTHFTERGVDSVRIRAPMDKSTDYSLAKTIAELGAEGWELVGCGNVAVDMHFLYFKRPRQEGQPDRAESAGEPLSTQP